VEQRTNATRQSVIVIASLVDKLPNLAGLSRTCEIFQAERLMLSDLSVVHEAEFKSISVTAHQWLPMEALPVAGIAAFIRARQAEGYTCIALEQSAASLQLPAYQFPSRVVILLGAEKEGVPVDLLNLVDHAVEIPQLGIIRSLNVHVSASILLWEYTRQTMLGLVAQSSATS
jgi:tRNA G18 (ribose-2'-O)-methylase SpoU